MGFASPEHGAHALDLQHAQISSLPVTGVEQRYPPGHVVPQHSHARGHLIYASEGVLLVERETVSLCPDASYGLLDVDLLESNAAATAPGMARRAGRMPRR